MNTQSTKKSFKLNFFDILLIVLAVLVIGAAGAFFAYTLGRSNENKTVIEYTVLVKDLPTEMQIHAEPGQTAIDTIKIKEIGEFVSVEKEYATYDAFDHENEVTVHGEYSDLYNAAFTFRAEAEKTESSYMIEEVRVSVGAEVHFRIPAFVGFGFVTDVKEITAAAE